MDFLKDIVMKRYAVKKFDGMKVSKEKMDELIEMIRYSASSFGLQPWKIKVVSEQAVKEKLQAASWNQPQVGTCSHLLVICANPNAEELIDKYEKAMINAGTPREKATGYADYIRRFAKKMSDEQRMVWAQKQCYIALGNAINGAKALGLDTCPMEGFDPKQYSEILALPEGIVPTLVVPVGYPADEPNPKIRFAKEDIVF